MFIKKGFILKRNTIEIFLLFVIFLFFFLIGSKNTYATCTYYTGCGYTYGGCVINLQGWCQSNEYACTYQETNLCCGCGDCQPCTPCSGNYQSSNNGCTATSVTCYRYRECGSCPSCGQTTSTCYPVKYTVTNDGNSGTCSPSSNSVCYGSASPELSCSRTGYTLTSYSVTSGSCGGTFNSSTGVCSSVTQNMTIQANWTINYYTVSALGNGGTCSPSTQSISYGSASGVVTCERSNYNFTGFTIDPSGNCGGTFNSSTGACNSVVGNFSITAQWQLANQAPTTPTTPYCMGTTNPTNITTQTPYFSAIFNDPDTGNTGNYYEIEVNTNDSFTGTVMWDSGSQNMTATSIGSRSPNIYYDGSSLGWSGTTYYWRIRFWDNGGLVSPWSEVQNFTMHSNSVPTAPTGLQTELTTDPIQVTDTTPEFRAIFNDPNTGDTGTQYEIEVNTNSSFTGTVMWDSGLQNMTSTPIGSYSPEISYNGTTLTLNGATYYWRIRFVDNYGYVGAWSATANFQMNNIPTATNPKTNGQTNPPKVPMTPYFTAVFNDADTSATGTHYEVEVNTASNFAGTVMWDSGQTAHSPAIPNGGTSSNITYGGSALSSGVLYYWRIRFWDNAGTPSNWSTTSNFRTTTPPSSPTGLLVDGQTNPTGLSTFTPPFSAIHNDLNGDSATYYEIEVNSSSAFNGTVMWDTGKTSTSVNNKSRSPNYIYAGTPLTGSGTTYYWRIRFWDVDDNTGAWSATATFRDSLFHFYLNGLQMNGIRLD